MIAPLAFLSCELILSAASRRMTSYGYIKTACGHSTGCLILSSIGMPKVFNEASGLSRVILMLLTDSLECISIAVNGDDDQPAILQGLREDDDSFPPRNIG